MTTTPTHHPPGVFPVTCFGAVGDGSQNDTEAMQRTIDACASAGGGRVLVTPGLYRTGTLYLRDNVELHISAGGTLLGSPDRSDYSADDAFPECRAFEFERVTGAHLIIGHGLRNVAITGCGTIDGNSRAFFDGLEHAEQPASYRYSTWNASLREWRPGQMIWLCRCRDVAVRDIRLRNSTYWSLMLYGCEDVRIRGLNIRNPPATPNGDGIDIDCSRNVTVSDCIIVTADDCITLRSDPSALGEARACEHVTVTNCLLSTPANCIRVGVGDGEIRNCSFNNLDFIDSRVGINMVSRYPRVGKRGTLIENIAFSDLSMDTILALQALHGANTQPGAGFRHVSFTNVRAYVTAGAYVGGNADNYARGFSFRDWDLHCGNEVKHPEAVDRVRYPDPIEGCTGADGERILPAALYARHVDDLQARNVRVHRSQALQRTWLRDTWFEQCLNVEQPGDRAKNAAVEQGGK